MKKKWYQSRKFWVAVVAAVVVALNTHYGWALEPEAIMVILSPFLIYIGVQGVVDARH